MEKFLIDDFCTYMVSVGVDGEAVINSYFKAYLETGDMNYFIIAHSLSKCGYGFSREEINGGK